jgi:glycosyltransferase involved in cell wall biosynthesis
MPTKKPRVAIIHDWLLTHRGGEKVLEAIVELFPDAEIFTLFHAPGRASTAIEKHPIHTSFLNRIPGVARFYRYLLPGMPFAVERFDLSGFDLVVSSSHCVAKGIIPSPGTIHICYCHTPMRYAWDRARDYFGNGLKSWLVLPFLHRLRLWDTVSAARVDYFIANSNWVSNRIETYYRRSSRVIHPFVDARFLNNPPQALAREDYFLVVSGFAPYKRIDLAIDACISLNRRLKIVGEGQNAKRLKSVEHPLITFTGRLDDEELKNLYAGARALLFPGEEDFGIVPLESMACGTPVIAYGRGGATETVLHEKTGVLFSEQSVASLSAAIIHFETLGLTSEPCRERARLFTKQKFQHEFKEALAEAFRKSGKSVRPLSPN